MNRKRLLAFSSDAGQAAVLVRFYKLHFSSRRTNKTLRYRWPSRHGRELSQLGCMFRSEWYASWQSASELILSFH